MAPTVGLSRAGRGDGEHIGAAEQLHLQFLPASSQRVELLGQVANAEVHVAVPVGEVESGGQASGHRGRTPWHSAPAPSRALQNVTPTQDPRMVRRIAGLRARYSSPGCRFRSGRMSAGFDHRGFL